MLKQLFGWAMTGFRPRCDTCGELLEVRDVGMGGTYYHCVNRDDEAHKKQGDMVRRWWEKIEALQKEFDFEDAGLTQNYARKHYGKIKVEVRRKAD
jgi:hypothetical protein